MEDEEEIGEEIQKTFGQRAIFNDLKIKQRLEELKANFYNRLEKERLIKKQGKVPFIEHLTIGKSLFLTSS